MKKKKEERKRREKGEWWGGQEPFVSQKKSKEYIEIDKYKKKKWKEKERERLLLTLPPFLPPSCPQRRVPFCVYWCAVS